LFGPAVFQRSKLKVLFLGTQKENHPGHFPRIYTLTHSDITAQLTLAISQTINKYQVALCSVSLNLLKIGLVWLKSLKSVKSLYICTVAGTV